MPERDTEEPRIHLMDDVLASQVAAGEVVERPSSVVKELVENSIDAGAHAVRVEIRRGGASLIRVSDDGCGMSRADASLCLRRHATSKLSCYDDLFDIRQLGFRGEALPSIASVSEFRLVTRRAEDVEGTLIRSEGGREEPPMSAGCAPGTDISVSRLFFNTPVRRKFLKSEETESGHIEHQLRLHALAFPGVRFTFIRDGQEVFDVPATPDLRRRVADFIGREAASRLLAIRPTEAPGVRVSGFLMPLSEARRNRKLQFVFLNGRPIEDKIVTRAVRDGYGGFPTGLHPSLFLYLEVDPGLVDVNVHPAKREVRFRRPSEVTTAIIDAVAGTLAAHARGGSLRPNPLSSSETPTSAVPNAAPHAFERPSQAPSSPSAEGKRVMPSLRREELESAALSSGAQDSPSSRNSPASRVPLALPPLVLKPVLQPHQKEFCLPPVSSDAPPASSGASSHATGTPPSSPVPEGRGTSPPTFLPGQPKFRYLGVLHARYALFENPEGLVLLSPRAARERVIFERLMESKRRPVLAQRLLAPELLDMESRDMGVALEVKPLLEKVGFVLSVFGQKTLRIEALPAFLPLSRAGEFLLELIQAFSSGETRLKRGKDPFSYFAIRLAHQYARREDMTPWLENAMSLLTDLLRCEIPYCTPGGKPTMIPFSLSEMNRRFQAQ